jgi:hypothetical protein
VRARSFRNLFDLIVGLGADAPLVQPELVTGDVQLQATIGSLEYALGARRGIRVFATLISSAAAGANSSIEIVNPGSGYWLRRMVNNTGNCQWALFISGGAGTNLTVTDGEPTVQICAMNEASTIVTNPGLLSTVLPGRVLFRSGRKPAVSGSSQFVVQGASVFDNTGAIWVPPGSLIEMDMVTQNVATQCQVDIELPVRGSDVLG